MRYIILLLILAGCGKQVIEVTNSEHTIHAVNPLIEFCERLYPEVLYPNEIERETLFIDCLKLCSEQGQCEFNLPTLPGGFNE